MHRKKQIQDQASATTIKNEEWAEEEGEGARRNMKERKRAKQIPEDFGEVRPQGDVGGRVPLEEMEGVGGDEDGSDGILEALPGLEKLYPNPTTVPGEEGSHGDVAVDIQLPGDDGLVHFLEATVGTAVQEQQSEGGWGWGRGRGGGGADVVVAIAVVVGATQVKGEEGEGGRLAVIVNHVIVGNRLQHHFFLVFQQSHTAAAVVFNRRNQSTKQSMA